MQEQTQEQETSLNQFQVDRIRDRMAELEESLNNSIPGFEHILSDIHKSLRDDPEIVTLLDPEEIAIIVRGLSAHANTVITTAKTKPKASRKKKVPISAADL